MPHLPPELIRVPVAHRGLHGPVAPENSLAAARAAINAGYGIEMDIQPAADGIPLVFHDYNLKRLTGEAGLVSAHPSLALSQMRLLDSGETIPTLAQMLDLVAGQVPLLIEIKDQDGRLGKQIGNLHNAVADALKSYRGAVAVMSFNPHIVTAFHKAAPEIPAGITSCGFPARDWPQLDYKTRSDLGAILEFDASGACFISHDVNDLTNPRVDALKALGVPVLCWTVCKAEQEAGARLLADNITFEGYKAEIPG